jgi:hypothetical protein
MRSEALSNMSECPVTEALFGHLRRSPLAGWDWQQARWLKPPSSPLRSRTLLQRGWPGATQDMCAHLPF